MERAANERRALQMNVMTAGGGRNHSSGCVHYCRSQVTGLCCCQSVSSPGPEHTCSPSPAAQLLHLAQQKLSRCSLTHPQLVQLSSVYSIRSEHIGEHETPRSFYSFSTGAQTPQSSLFSALQDSSALLHLPGGGDQMKLRPSTKLPTTWSNKVYLLRPRLLTNRPSGPKPLLLFLLCVMTSFTLLAQLLKAGGGLQSGDLLVVSSTGDFFLATVLSLLRHQLVSCLCRAHIDIEDIDLCSSASPSAEGAPLFSYRQVFVFPGQ